MFPNEFFTEIVIVWINIYILRELTFTILLHFKNKLFCSWCNFCSLDYSEQWSAFKSWVWLTSIFYHIHWMFPNYSKLFSYPLIWLNHVLSVMCIYGFTLLKLLLNMTEISSERQTVCLQIANGYAAVIKYCPRVFNYHKFSFVKMMFL